MNINVDEKLINTLFIRNNGGQLWRKSGGRGNLESYVIESCAYCSYQDNHHEYSEEDIKEACRNCSSLEEELQKFQWRNIKSCFYNEKVIYYSSKLKKHIKFLLENFQHDTVLNNYQLAECKTANDFFNKIHKYEIMPEESFFCIKDNKPFYAKEFLNERIYKIIHACFSENKLKHYERYSDYDNEKIEETLDFLKRNEINVVYFYNKNKKYIMQFNSVRLKEILNKELKRRKEKMNN